MRTQGYIIFLQLFKAFPLPSDSPAQVFPFCNCCTNYWSSLLAFLLRRLMVYPDRVLTHIHKRVQTASPNSVDVISAAQNLHGGSGSRLPLRASWEGLSCCLQRKQNCVDRDSWVPVSSSSVPILNYSGIYVPLGNSNFLLESYHSCVMVPYDAEKAARDPEYSPCP